MWVTVKLSKNVLVTYYKQKGGDKIGGKGSGRHRKRGRPKGSKQKRFKKHPFRIVHRGAVYQFKSFTRRGRPRKR